MPKLKQLFRRLKAKKDNANAIEKLLETTEMLQKKSSYLDKKIENEENIALRHRIVGKKAALEALKRKKRYEQQQHSVVGTLSTVKFQLENLQNARLNKHILDTLRSSAREQKKAHKHVSPDGIHDVLDDINDQKDISDELAQLFTGVNFNEDVNEDELLSELKDLEREDFEERVLAFAPLNNGLTSLSGNSKTTRTIRAVKELSREVDDITRLEAWAEKS